MASSAPHPETARGPRSTRPSFPAAPVAPAPPQTGPRRRWQWHLHIWRPCSRFRDGARAVVTSPRTMRASARGGDVHGADLRAWRRGRKGWGLDASRVRHNTKPIKQSLSRLRSCQSPSFAGWESKSRVPFLLLHPGSRVAFNYISLVSSTL